MVKWGQLGYNLEMPSLKNHTSLANRNRKTLVSDSAAPTSASQVGGSAYEPQTGDGFFAGLFKIILLAFGLALIVRMFLVQPFNIPSGSMRPTLLVGDFIYVSKTSYGYSKASLVWPLSQLPLRGRLMSRNPERGAVVVFKNKKDNNQDYIKRVIGLPGDEILIFEGTVYVNGSPINRDYLGAAPAICDGVKEENISIYRETLPNGASYNVQECDGDEGALDSIGPYTVPTGHYFMMGDNRDRSQDSRVRLAVGTVPFDDLVGEAKRVVISVQVDENEFWQFWKWPNRLRGERFLKSLK